MNDPKNLFKMADGVLKGCKMYVVERVISPGAYRMIEYGKGMCYKKDRERFEHLLAKHIQKCQNNVKVPIGEIIAIKDERGFHRGVVTDSFKRSFKNTYLIVLVDYGNIIEIDQGNIYFIQNQELKDKKLSAFEVTIHGIQPAVVELECDKNISDGLFQKKVASSWSPAAFKLVEDIFKKNPWVLVKPVVTKGRNISGDIYFVDESVKTPVSLGQKLCSEGFAIFCEASPKLKVDSLHGDNDIDTKIPLAALCRETQNSKISEGLRFICTEKGKAGSSDDDSIFHLQDILQRGQNKSSTESFHKKSCNSSLNSCTSLSILKKCESIGSSPCDSYKTHKTYNESKQVEGYSPENFSGSIFRVLQRSMESFNKQIK